MASNPVIIGRANDKWTAIYAFEEHGGEIKYVGKTTQYLIDRRKEHLRSANGGNQKPFYRWLRKRCAAQGFVTRLIEHVPPGGDWASRERHWIKHYRERGDRILNLTDGGEGLAGHVFSLEHRAKIAAKLRTGQEFSCETCGEKFWRKQYAIKNGDNRFCSRPCYSQSLKGVPRAFDRAATEKGIAAAADARRARTHCKRGHPLSGDNLFLTSSGSRACKECRKIHKLTYRSKRNG